MNIDGPLLVKKDTDVDSVRREGSMRSFFPFWPLLKESSPTDLRSVITPLFALTFEKINSPQCELSWLRRLKPSSASLVSEVNAPTPEVWQHRLKSNRTGVSPGSETFITLSFIGFDFHSHYEALTAGFWNLNVFISHINTHTCGLHLPLAPTCELGIVWDVCL